MRTYARTGCLPPVKPDRPPDERTMAAAQMRKWRRYGAKHYPARTLSNWRCPSLGRTSLRLGPRVNLRPIFYGALQRKRAARVAEHGVRRPEPGWLPNLVFETLEFGPWPPQHRKLRRLLSRFDAAAGPLRPWLIRTSRGTGEWKAGTVSQLLARLA